MRNKLYICMLMMLLVLFSPYTEDKDFMVPRDSLHFENLTYNN